MPYIVHIRNNETNEVREYVDRFDWDDEYYLFMWTDGNYACDCNRFLFFERAAGHDPEWDEGPCGDTKYTVLKAVLPDGREIPIDTETSRGTRFSSGAGD